MEVRKTSLGDGDGLGDKAYVVVDLAPLAGQTPAGPGSDIAGKTAPHKPRWNNTTGEYDESEKWKKKVIVRAVLLEGRCCLSFPMRTLGFKALHFHGKVKQFKVRLPFALSKLSKQSIFQKVEQLGRVVTDIKSIQNCPEGLAWAGWQRLWRI
jgi:hypothetical protein